MFDHPLICTFSWIIYDVFDVYNNGYDLGGQLRIEFDRKLIIISDGRAISTKSLLYPKVVRRKKLNDVVLRIGLMVSFKDEKRR